MHPRDKIVACLSELSSICQTYKMEGKKVVLTSGCFDLLHGGHLEYIFDSAKLGHHLIVGVNSDLFVKKLKGENRPVRDQDDRAFMIAGFYLVSHVIVFDCDYELIEAVRPNVYTTSMTSHVTIDEDVKRAALLENVGSEIIEIASKKEESTTEIIKRASAQ
jgi:glycerol-3-phosphate cytidylyltransferase